MADEKNTREKNLGFNLRNLASPKTGRGLLSLGSPRTKTAIPISYDPVFTYSLPPLDEFLATEAGEKSFRRVLEIQHATDNLDCFQAIKKFQKQPTRENLEIVWNNFVSEKAIRQVNLTARVYTEISSLIVQGVMTKHMFDIVLDALRQIMIQNWYNGFRYQSSQFISWFTKIRTTPAFEDWLLTQGTSSERLRDEWWEKNKNSKWYVDPILPDNWQSNP